MSIDRTSRNAPKTGAACTCKRGQQRDNCPQCEGTGQVIDFRKLRERGLAILPPVKMPNEAPKC